MTRRILAALCLAASLACGGGGLEQLDPPPLMLAGQSPPDAGMKPAAACGPAALCARTINECSQNLTQSSCEGWYANANNCRDMAAYTACNCECIGEATCSDYFACGNLCFNQHCK